MIDMSDGSDVHVGFVAVEFVPGGGEGSARKVVIQTRTCGGLRLRGEEEETPCRLVGEGGEAGAAHAHCRHER